MIEIILTTYFLISVISLLATILWINDYEIKGIDNFWDLIIYNLFWIIQPIKAIIKFIKYNIK